MRAVQQFPNSENRKAMRLLAFESRCAKLDPVMTIIRKRGSPPRVIRMHEDVPAQEIRLRITPAPQQEPITQVFRRITVHLWLKIKNFPDVKD